MKIRKIIKRILIICICLGVVSLGILLGINAHVKHTVKDRIVESDSVPEGEADCILVLGCQVKESGEPSHMLRDRLQRGVELYELGAADKLLMSGDHGRTDYNEVETMKQYAIDESIDSANVFMDHAGFSTYESIYRAKEVFGVKKMVIITQEYHLYRALYIADKLGIEAYGVASDYHIYAGQSMRDLREVLARAKDFVTTIVKPEPTYLGDFIDIHGDGDITND
ncbi:MAG: YdcF family protein [Tyzzerella sp.]|nr:YdcF family protein [Tyzzerella sp.]